MHSIQSFASSMVSIFIPIYFLNLSYSVPQVIKFYIVHYLLLLAFAFITIYVVRLIGLQQTILARAPFKLIYYILLVLLPIYNFPIYIIAFFSGLEAAMYWIPLHIIFSRYSNKNEMGEATGKLFALPKLFSIFSPLIGGFIAVTFGFSALLVTVFIFVLIAIIPLLLAFSNGDSFIFKDGKFIPKKFSSFVLSVYCNLVEALHAKSTFKFEIKKGWRLFKDNKKYFLAEILDNIGEEVEAIIWPIFVFLTLENVAAVGIVGTLLNIGSFLFTLLVGRISDKISKKKLIKFGAILLTLTWLCRYYINQEYLIYLITIIAGFITVLFLVPFTSYGYALPKRSEINEFFVFREIPVAIGRVVILIIALLLIDNLSLVFPVAGLAYLYFLFF